MRDIVLLAFTLVTLGFTFRFPFVGMGLWIFFSIMNPHQEAYGFAMGIPWNLIIALVTTASWLISSEHKLPHRNATTILVFLLLAWSTFNTFMAFDPSYSWTYWNRAWKTIAMCVLANLLTTNMVRFQTLIWIVALSLGFYGVKGGIFTLVTGGQSHVFGPPQSMIFDNNTLADALVMLLPMLNYLRQHSASRWIRIFLILAVVLTVASVLGSYSREAYIGLAVLALAFWTRTPNKLAYPIVVAIILVPLIHYMPESFYQRASSIQDLNTDESFQARLDSWWVAYRYAMDHVPFGAGFYGMNLQGVWDQYIPGEMHAAHSVYFQVLGEQGIPGLALYLLTIASAFLNFRVVRRATRNVPDLRWARDLADMMRLSVITFCVTGAAAPIAFFDLFFLWIMLSARLREVARPRALSGADAGLGIGPVGLGFGPQSPSLQPRRD